MNYVLDAPESLYKLVETYGTASELRKHVPISYTLASKLIRKEPVKIKYSTYAHINICIKNSIQYSFPERIRYVMQSKKARTPFIKHVRTFAKFIADNEWLLGRNDNTSIFSESPTHAPLVAAVTAMKDCLKLFVAIHRSTKGEFDDVLFSGTGFVELFNERVSRYEGKKNNQEEER